MSLEILAESGCADRTCPTVYLAEDGSVVIQGFIPSAEVAEHIAPPEGEQAVLVPRELLEAAVAALARR